MKFDRGDFHWNIDRLTVTDDKLKDITNILNNLTDEQIEAVKVYGRSNYEEGYDSGAVENSD